MKTLEFYYDFASPMAYLGYYRLLEIAQRVPVNIIYKPVLLGALHNDSGNTAPGLVPAKANFMIQDIQRHSAYYDIPFNFNPNFPVNCISALRGAIFLDKLGSDVSSEQAELYRSTMFDAVWRNEKNIADASVFESLLFESGLAEMGINASTILDGITHSSVKEQLKANTTEAVERGAFGAPTFFIDDALYFGQDRLDFVERLLRN